MRGRELLVVQQGKSIARVSFAPKSTSRLPDSQQEHPASKIPLPSSELERSLEDVRFYIRQVVGGPELICRRNS